MRISMKTGADYRALLIGDPSPIDLKFSRPPESALSSLAAASPEQPKSVLLLGANGFLGVNILEALVRHPRVSRVFAIVRRRRNRGAAQRVKQKLKRFGLSLREPAKLSILEGGFTEPGLGVPPEDYERLVREVDTIINAAGSTNHTYPYSYYRGESIGTQLRLLEFSLTHRLKQLHCVGSMGCEVFKRKLDFYRLGFFHCGYSRMKWVMKHLIKRANGYRLPAYVYLPPFVLGGESTNYKDPGKTYSFWQMVSYAHRLGKIWASSDPVPIVTADGLARAVIDNMFSPAPQAVVYTASTVSNEELAARFNWQVVSWKEFYRDLQSRFGFRVAEIDFEHPIRSIRKQLKHRFFVRALFPRYLPEVIRNLNPPRERTRRPEADPLRPVEVVVRCAKTNLRIEKLEAAA